MLHVKQITEIVDAGQTDEAHEALDELLALGPHNTEALKLKARLFAYEGRFGLEHRTWDRIASIDPEDEDAVLQLWNRQVEEREHFYFTDDLPGGGRRFMAYPRRLVMMSVLGLSGCLAFLLVTRFAGAYPVLGEPLAMLSLFAFFVLSPWIGIIWSYFRSIRSVLLSREGIVVTTRIKDHSYSWGDLDKICMARSVDAKRAWLSLVVIPKAEGSPVVEIDMRDGSSAIRARSFLIREIGRLFKEPDYERRDTLALDKRKIASY